MCVHSLRWDKPTTPAKAAYFYNKCIDQARKNGDMEFINKATIRLEQIK